MTGTLLDDRISIAKESVYGTKVTTTRFYPMLPDTVGEFDPRPAQGKGLHGGTGRHAPIAARIVMPEGQGTVTLVAELESKAGGMLIEAGVGTATVTALAGTPGGSQQVSTTAVATPYLPSYTIQLVTVLNDGTERVRTFVGCTAKKTKISQPEDDFATIEVEFDALDMDTVTAAATAVYATTPVLFHAVQAGVSTGTTGLTVPTTTALATGLTADATWREWEIEINHSIDEKDWRLGRNRGRPVIGNPEITLSGKFDFDTATLIAGYEVGTIFSWYSTHTTTEVIVAATTYTGLQIVIPSLIITKLPVKPKPGDRRTLDLSADVKWDGTNADLYVVYRTTDTAL